MPLEIITISIAAFAAVWDLRTRKIPNWLTFPAMLLGIGVMTWQNGLPGLISSIGGLLLGVALLFLFFLIGGMGAGDVKLLGAIGALQGGHFVWFTFLYGAVAGGVIAAVILAWHGQLYNVVLNVYISLKNFLGVVIRSGGRHPLLPVSSGIRFPYGIAILAGAILASCVR